MEQDGVCFDADNLMVQGQFAPGDYRFVVSPHATPGEYLFSIQTCDDAVCN